MSVLKRNDFHTPLSNVGITKLFGHVTRCRSEQTAAASLAASPLSGGNPITQDATIVDAYVISSAVAGSGESIVVDLLLNGVSLLSGTYTFDSTKTAKTQLKLALSSMPGVGGRGGPKVVAGDILTCTRTYTAGGSPTMVASAVVVELATPA